MNQQPQMVGQRATTGLATSSLIRNTYTLLSATLLFSALMAGLSIVLRTGIGTNLFCFIASMALMWFVLPRTANSATGIAVVFAITGLLGFGLGPLLSYYLAMKNGGQIIMTAFGGTGVIFLGLSGYAMTSRKDFSFLGGTLVAGLLVVLLAIVASLFLNIPGLSLAISAVVIILMSGFILYDTSRIVNGGETNYIMATISLYLSIYNLFSHLLHLLGALQGDD